MNKKFDPLALSEFARHYGFHYDNIDPFLLVNDIIAEMEKGLNGAKSSLPMIPAYLAAAAKTISGKTVIALDAGGTNLRSALVKFDSSGRAAVLESRKVPMPGTSGSLGAEAFFDEIAAVTAPLVESAAENIDGIGFCFSYNMEITKDTDGILKSFSKEIEAGEVIGMALGKGLREALLRRKVNAPERIVLLNDTVATLLSGLTEIPLNGKEAGAAIGFILGTGINTAYPEACIPKIGFNSKENQQIVVCESGSFSHRYMGELDREFDSTTKMPGAYTLEKATAGAYLGPLSFHIICRAIKDGLFTFGRASEFLSLSALQTKDLNAFQLDPTKQSGPVGSLFGKDEKDAIASFLYLASIITKRAGILSASVLAAAVRKAQNSFAAFDPCMPVRIAVEGTTFMVYKGMRSALEAHLHAILNKEKPCSYIIAPVEQASLFGAAVAALSQ